MKHFSCTSHYGGFIDHLPQWLVLHPHETEVICHTKRTTYITVVLVRSISLISANLLFGACPFAGLRLAIRRIMHISAYVTLDPDIRMLAQDSNLF
jgi:hypothetical protein